MGAQLSFVTSQVVIIGTIKNLGLICLAILQMIPTSSSSVFKRYEYPSIREGKSAKLLDPTIQLFNHPKIDIQTDNEIKETIPNENLSDSLVIIVGESVEIPATSNDDSNDSVSTSDVDSSESLASILFDLEPTSDNIKNMANILFDSESTVRPIFYDYESELDESEAESVTELSIIDETDEERASRHSPDFADYGGNNFKTNMQFYNLQNNQKIANQPQDDHQYRQYPQHFLQKKFPQHHQPPQQEHLFSNDRVFSSRPQTQERPQQEHLFSNDRGLSSRPQTQERPQQFVDDNLAVREADDDIRCLKKVMQVEKTVYEEKVRCQHTFTEKCHDSIITDYVPSQERKCETSYNKKCHITYAPQMYEEDVEICSEPLRKVCNDTIKGPEVCKTHYETKCETRHKEHNIEQDEPVCQMEIEKKCRPAALRDSDTGITGDTGEALSSENEEDIQDPADIANKLFGEEECEDWPVRKCHIEKKLTTKTTPETSCKKIPNEICAPSNCKFVPHKKECRTEKRNVIQRLPEEECGIEPQENCNMETVLVPKLRQQKNCVKVPKEICVNEERNPKKVTEPVVKEWCYRKSDLNSPQSREFLKLALEGGPNRGKHNQGFR